jgi:hypothetical protein
MVPFPRPFRWHGLGAWKCSFFGDMHAHDKETCGFRRGRNGSCKGGGKTWRRARSSRRLHRSEGFFCVFGDVDQVASGGATAATPVTPGVGIDLESTRYCDSPFASKCPATRCGVLTVSIKQD